MTIPIVAHSYDPYHGDLNNRHPRLGAPVKRVVEREQWTDFRLAQFATMNNGIFAYVNKRGADGGRDASVRDTERDFAIERSAFGRELEPRSIQL